MTDHYAKALASLQYVSTTEMASTEALVSVTAAQVHAVLALAEQQRIANLIALAKMSWEPLEEGGYGEGAALANEALHSLIEYAQVPATQTTSEDEFPMMDSGIARTLRIETP